jgi:hypothetical protein
VKPRVCQCADVFSDEEDLPPWRRALQRPGLHSEDAPLRQFLRDHFGLQDRTDIDVWMDRLQIGYLNQLDIPNEERFASNAKTRAPASRAHNDKAQGFDPWAFALAAPFSELDLTSVAAYAPRHI